MVLCVVGAGYVGLVVAACMADLGHDVVCVETHAARLEALRAGALPIFEPGLDDIVARTVASGRLRFEADLDAGCAGVGVVFVAVGTPPGPTGEADVSAVREVAGLAARSMAQDGVLVVKSTVPVGTADALRVAIHEAGHRGIDVVSNPEFLAEGSAIDDFMQPDRIVLGYARAEAGARMEHLYAPMVRSGRPVLHMDNRSAEMSKYAANVALAARVSLMNELANLAEATGADIERVRLVVGSDERVGSRYLFPGAGFGGSCFPKDLLALEHMAEARGVDLSMIRAVRTVNDRQKHVLFHKARALLGGDVAGRCIGVWGLAFKPGTDDVRQAPALTLLRDLIDAGATVQAYDPKAMAHAAEVMQDAVVWSASALDAAAGADALIVVTEWPEFRSPPWRKLARAMRGRILVDGRNLYAPGDVARAGFTYASIGRPNVVPSDAEETV